MKSLSQKIADYKPKPETAELIKSTPILFLVGPFGAGKDSLRLMLLKSGKFHYIVSHTTREPRINHGVSEKDGVDYHFIDKSEAERMIDNQQFVEVKNVHNNIYGTSLGEIETAKKDGKIAITDIDVQGVAEYEALDSSVIAVYLLPPDFSTWQKRLASRYGDVVDATDHKRRLESALNELGELLSTNYYAAVINDNLDDTYKKILQIVDSKDHQSPDQAKALNKAKQLVKDIETYLSSNR